MVSLKEIGLVDTIDCHTHSGGVDLYNLYTGDLPMAQSVDDLVLKARSSGISKVVTFPFPTTGYYNVHELVTRNVRIPSGQQDFPYQVENMALIKGCENSDLPLLPFMAIDPSNHIQEQVDSLRQNYKKRKFYGLKLHTLATGSTADKLIGSEIVEFAQEKNIPIIIHSGLGDEHSHPQNIVKLAKQSPNLRVCVAHLAWLDEDTIKNVAKTNNVFIDTCPFLQICNRVRKGSKMVFSPNLIDPNKPAESLFNYYKLLKNNLIWGTDEPWTKCISARGNVSSNHTYGDEAQVISDLFQISPQAALDITSRNTERFIFGS